MHGSMNIKFINTWCHTSNSSNLTLTFHIITTAAWFEVTPYHVCPLTDTITHSSIYTTHAEGSPGTALMQKE